MRDNTVYLRGTATSSQKLFSESVIRTYSNNSQCIHPNKSGRQKRQSSDTDEWEAGRAFSAESTGNS